MMEGKDFIHKVVQVVRGIQESFTIDYVVDILCGAKHNQVMMFNHHMLDVFGIGKDHDDHFWNSVLRQALLHNLIIKDIENYGVIKLSDKGRKFFFITGRIKELIIRGGINIAPLEIDEVLMSISEIKAGIAVGFDNDWYGEEVGALVQLKEGFDANEYTKADIITKCKESLPFYKSPKVVIFTDTIPVTSTGKYQRNKVKHLFAEFKTVQFKN
jgi:superfamily II DNA helicase RecQ